MNGGPHDCLGKYVEEVCTNGEYTFYTSSHESRGNNEPSPGTDAAGDQAGAKTDHDGNQEYLGGIRGRSIGAFSPEYRRFTDRHRKDREQKDEEDKESLRTFYYVRGDFQIPLGMGDGRSLQELKNLSTEVQTSSVGHKRLS